MAKFLIALAMLLLTQHITNAQPALPDATLYMQTPGIMKQNGTPMQPELQRQALDEKVGMPENPPSKNVLLDESGKPISREEAEKLVKQNTH